MHDECGHCTVKGDLVKCLETICSKRDDWIVKTLIDQLQLANINDRIKLLERQVAILVELVDKSNCCGFCGVKDCSKECRGSVMNWSLEKAKEEIEK